MFRVVVVVVVVVMERLGGCGRGRASLSKLCGSACARLTLTAPQLSLPFASSCLREWRNSGERG